MNGQTDVQTDASDCFTFPTNAVNKDNTLFVVAPLSRSIVMSTSVCVCVSVCLSAKISPKPHARSLPFFVLVAYGHGSGLPPAGWRNPKGRGSFGCFLPHWQCIVQHSIWDPYNTAWTDRDAVRDDKWACPVKWQSPKGKGQFLKKTCPTGLTPICE